MADEFRFNAFFRGADRRRYVQLGVTAITVFGLLGLSAALVRPVVVPRHTSTVQGYVSLINQGQLQVCRVTSDGVKCPPLSTSLSKSASLSKSKSASLSKSTSTSTSLAAPSKSLSTSTSLAAPSKSLSTSTSLSASTRTQ
ncbi:MAG TPA: hypothetical protein VKR56_00420 [Candidatus Cybelea sp.]|nr:hypothetical protein [Candidatus Cybelea sp.]